MAKIGRRNYETIFFSRLRRAKTKYTLQRQTLNLLHWKGQEYQIYCQLKPFYGLMVELEPLFEEIDAVEG